MDAAHHFYIRDFIKSDTHTGLSDAIGANIIMMLHFRPIRKQLSIILMI